MNLTIQTTTPALCKKEIGEDKITIDEINLDDEEYEKDDKINPSITISNNGEDDLEITVEAYLYDINDKKDLISTNLTNTVSAGDSESYDLELITPAIKESRFKLYFKVYQKDEERDICLQEGKDIKIVSSIPEDFIAITNTKITKKLQEDQVITLKINNEYHDLEVLQVYTDKVKVEISSDPIEVVLDVAQTKEIDVNGDGINDLSITLDLIKDKKASLSFKLADGGTITPPPEAECTNGQTQECGTDIGICKKGTQTCINEQWTLCNDIKPTQETCNDNLDNDCNGKTDCSDDSCLNEPECKIEGGEDTDNDGLPDKWELKYFGNLRQGPDDDSDGDGFSNIDEYSKDTNPKDSSDFPKKDSNLIIIVTIVAVLGIAGFLVWKFTRKKPGTGINSNVSSGVNPALTNYIKSALQQGYNKQQIRSILLKKNWTSKDIEDAFKNI